jgi:hypothetical protein
VISAMTCKQRLDPRGKESSRFIAGERAESTILTILYMKKVSI